MEKKALFVSMTLKRAISYIELLNDIGMNEFEHLYTIAEEMVEEQEKEMAKMRSHSK